MRICVKIPLTVNPNVKRQTPIRKSADQNGWAKATPWLWWDHAGVIRNCLFRGRGSSSSGRCRQSYRVEELFQCRQWRTRVNDTMLLVTPEVEKARPMSRRTILYSIWLGTNLDADYFVTEGVLIWKQCRQTEQVDLDSIQQKTM
jgi:hypothetical protein